MPNIYCPSCGQGIKYLYKKPEECNFCNHSFSIAVYNSDEEEEDTRPEITVKRNTKKTPSLKKINVEVDAPLFEKFGEVMGSNPGETRQRRRHTTKEDLKSRIFKNTPSSVDDV